MMTLDRRRQPISDTTGVGRLRHALVDDLADRGFGGKAYDAGVMVSELVANVLQHTGSAALVEVEIGDNQARVAVHDDSDALPTLRPIDPQRIGGNGMRVVDAFADGWGIDPDPAGGKTVWFTVRRAS